MAYKRAVIITAKDVQDEEYLYPYYRLQEEGFDLEVVVVGSHDAPKGKYGIPIRPAPNKVLLVPNALSLPLSQQFDLIVIPGGWAPEIVRKDEHVRQFIYNANHEGKILSAICHGPQVLISSLVCHNKKMTCYEGMSDDLENASAEYMGPGTFVDGNIVTADHYRENPSWMKRTLEAYNKFCEAEYTVH